MGVLMRVTLQQNSRYRFGYSIVIYIVASLFLFFEMGVQVSPSVMAVDLMQDLHLSAFGLGLMSGCYFYTYTLMQIPSGIVLDKFNPRYVISLSILTCAIGTFILSLAHGVYVAAFARLFMGLGSAFAFVSVLVVTADLFPNRYFATITGFTQALAALGAMSGQLPVSLLVKQVGWRVALQSLAIMGVILAVLVWLLITYQRQSNSAQEKQVTPPENTVKQVNTILRNRQTWYLAGYACLLWAPMSGFASLWGVPYLTKVDHLTTATAALVCSAMWLGLAVGSPLLGWLSTYLQQRKLPLYLSALIGSIAFFVLLGFSLTPVETGIVLFIAGAACAGQALSFTLVKEINQPSSKAKAIAINNMAVVISGAFFQPLVGKIIDATSAKSPILAQKYGAYTMLLAYVISCVLAMTVIKDSLSGKSLSDV